MNQSGLPPLIHAARDQAQVLLAPLPQRWRHTVGVARRAEGLIHTLDGDDPDVLIAAAWLHDIGYAPTVTDTGFHPLDGARHLQHTHWPARITALVAHHSGALHVARERGLHGELAIYPCEVTTLADALTYADQTVDPDGHRVSVDQRIAEALLRHGPDSAQAAARPEREPYLRAVAERIERRLARHGHSER
ncbi:HD domain-containing protein [Virgisporangium aurantiacum]|uniref:Metal-dependent phosphohydrolase, HD subdomain protein n=1 Tax=Virgisporangium aurantiacum TaxID=175570 RepID=A0A8J3Z385_9ACTN|nr:HD domain-containing protein [Virgisporangium aurantiacum]GIJ54233.1 metal-dependent phosphohydrolase, HD subdomain protein [Virgisporangium aurantiacum]